ncbi:GntR family transcriptional regulator [Paenibacillus sanguinis]|uniref:GntR family transcriptional regulator n=1 Tax=Paenibacillus sanguinis TaxID=225906 RepID=UPI0003A8CF97|nr:GntR family transcriptional regulator [Paenibacillus sanguinis]
MPSKIMISPSISEQVYQHIKEDILSGVYTPGDRLLVLELANRFQVSQAPVREALERLKFDELIIGSPNKGSVVSNISAKEIRDIFELRELIEGYAIRKALPKLGEDDFDYMKRMVELMDVAIQERNMVDILKWDLNFHGHLYNRCGNQMTIDMWKRMKMKMKHFMAISLKINTTDEMIREHYDLLDCLKAGDPDATEQRFIAHMQAYKVLAI